MNILISLIILLLFLLSGCHTENTHSSLTTFKAQELNDKMIIDSSLQVKDSLAYPLVRKYYNVSKTLEGASYTPVLKYKDSTIYRSGSRFRQCRCKMNKDTLFMEFSFGVMDVHVLNIKIVQDRFKLFARFYTDTPAGYRFETLNQILALNKKHHKVNDYIIGKLDYAGIANHPFGPKYPDYFLKAKGIFKCKLQPWNAFIVKQYGRRWDNVF